MLTEFPWSQQLSLTRAIKPLRIWDFISSIMLTISFWKINHDHSFITVFLIAIRERDALDNKQHASAVWSWGVFFLLLYKNGPLVQNKRLYFRIDGKHSHLLGKQTKKKTKHNPHTSNHSLTSPPTFLNLLLKNNNPFLVSYAEISLGFELTYFYPSISWITLWYLAYNAT